MIIRNRDPCDLADDGYAIGVEKSVTKHFLAAIILVWSLFPAAHAQSNGRGSNPFRKFVKALPQCITKSKS